MKVTAKDLRTQTRRLLDAVDRGEQVVITYRGKPRARLVPAEEYDEVHAETGLFGLWADDEGSADVEHFVDDLRRPRL